MMENKQENIWNIVKVARTKQLLNFEYFGCSFDMVDIEYINETIRLLEMELELPTILQPEPIEIVQDDILKTAAEIFIYLSYCPKQIMTDYKTILNNHSSKQILTDIVIMIKNSQNAEKESSIKIWDNVMNTVEMSYYRFYPIVDDRKNPIICKNINSSCSKNITTFGK